MQITAIIFALSFVLFASYTSVSLKFVSKKRNALNEELHSLVMNNLVNAQGQFIHNDEIAIQLLQSMNDKFQEYYEYSDETSKNIMLLSIITTIIGVLLAMTKIIM